MFGNVRGLIDNGGFHKIKTISDMAKNCFMLNFTESHLNKYISQSKSEIQGWEQLRCDRKNRLGGGVICYVRDTLPICNSLLHSNSYCEVVCFNIPSLNMLNITIYRPPGCPKEKLDDAMKTISEWVHNNETSNSPRIIFNGDFNLPFMKNWDEDSITSILEHCIGREDRGQNISQDKIQARILAEFTQRNVMTQFMDSPTRKNNILDLFFCSDPGIILETDILENVIFSDHTLNFIKMDLEIKAKNIQYNRTSTTIFPEYNTKNASDEEWNNVFSYLSGIDWENTLSKGTQIDILADRFMENFEKSISMNLRRNDNFKV